MKHFFWELAVLIGGVFGAAVGFAVLTLVFVTLAVSFFLMYRTVRNPRRINSRV